MAETRTIVSFVGAHDATGFFVARWSFALARIPRDEVKNKMAATREREKRAATGDGREERERE